MRTIGAAFLVAALVAPGLAAAQNYHWRGPQPGTAFQSGRAPWNQPWQYDTDGGNDRRPELPYYQQGGGQQTGGPARNLLYQDGFTLTPR